jgi:hypothetical protein
VLCKVAITSWGVTDRLSGAGIIIYPAPFSKVVLAGAIFLTSVFPDFVTIPSPTFLQIPAAPSSATFAPPFTSASHDRPPHSPYPSHHDPQLMSPRSRQDVHESAGNHYGQFGYVLHTSPHELQFAPSHVPVDSQHWQYSHDVDENFISQYPSTFNSAESGQASHRR